VGASTLTIATTTTNEWGHPNRDDQRLFEKICLEGFQFGPLLAHHPCANARISARPFDWLDSPDRAYNDGPAWPVCSAMRASSAHRGKIKATIHNAPPRLELVGPTAAWPLNLWQWEPAWSGARFASAPAHSPPFSAAPRQRPRPLSADLKARGWMFVGPTTA